MQDKELPFIQNMFDAIAPKYDLLNRLLSLRQDVVWRKQMILALHPQSNDLILDVACGTGDVALAACNAGSHPINIVGADFAHRMLTKAQKKIALADQSASIALVSADALSMPFRNDLFDAVTIAFGIRNIVDKKRALANFYRHLKPGGRLLVLELTTPSKGPLRWLYLRYFEKILPLIGARLSKHNQAYRYLPESVLKFPSAARFAAMMRSAGFRKVRWKPLTFGIATLFVGRKEP